MDNGRNRIAGMDRNEKASDNRRNSEGYLSFLAKENICNPFSGMEGVYRVIIAMHDLIGLEFSLLNQMNARFVSEKPQKGRVVYSH